MFVMLVPFVFAICFQVTGVNVLLTEIFHGYISLCKTSQTITLYKNLLYLVFILAQNLISML